MANIVLLGILVTHRQCVQNLGFFIRIHIKAEFLLRIPRTGLIQRFYSAGFRVNPTANNLLRRQSRLQCCQVAFQVAQGIKRLLTVPFGELLQPLLQIVILLSFPHSLFLAGIKLSICRAHNGVNMPDWNRFRATKHRKPTRSGHLVSSLLSNSSPFTSIRSCLANNVILPERASQARRAPKEYKD